MCSCFYVCIAVPVLVLPHVCPQPMCVGWRLDWGPRCILGDVVTSWCLRQSQLFAFACELLLPVRTNEPPTIHVSSLTCSTVSPWRLSDSIHSDRDHDHARYMPYITSRASWKLHHTLVAASSQFVGLV